jgi:hypothetical protein
MEHFTRPGSPAICMLISSLLLSSVGQAEEPVAQDAAGTRLQAPFQNVVPIDWSRFERAGSSKSAEVDERYEQAATLVLNCARYSMGWAEEAFEKGPAGQAYVLTDFKEHGVRPSCSAAYGMAVVLKTGIFDPAVVGVSEEEAKLRTLRLIRGVVEAHKANAEDPERAWGNAQPAPDSQTYQQPALWAALSGMAGWILWEDLDPDTREMMLAMLEYESNRFFEPGYKVPYWNGRDGDTKAEENSWHAMLLNLAVAMMPDHPDAMRWKRASSALMISSYATEEDWKSNTTVVDGQRVSAWLDGYNAEPGGVVVNHGFIHPDYMVAISMNFWGLTTQSLAGNRAPEAWDFNGPLVYDTCITRSWASPPFEAPGGTIYIPGKANVYYPKGNDWSFHDLTLFYLMDVYGQLFSWQDTAGEWMDIRAGAMLRMQQRHDDRRMFADGEYDTYTGREQWAFWCLTDAFLPLWLEMHDGLSKKSNWLAVGTRD